MIATLWCDDAPRETDHMSTPDTTCDTDALATPPHHADPRLAVTIDEACVMTGLGRSTVYRLIAAERLDARRAGRRTLVMVASIRAYLDSLPRVGTGEASP